ncbi:MAG: hypothetical protein ACO3O3_12370 [Ilumatobacteraceae bacterium]
MDANFVLFCFVFLGALLLISFDALGEYHDDVPVDECGLCGEQPVYMSGVCLDCFHVEFGLDSQR